MDDEGSGDTLWIILMLGKDLYKFEDPITGSGYVVVRNPKAASVQRCHSAWENMWIGPKLIPLPESPSEQDQLLDQLKECIDVERPEPDCTTGASGKGAALHPGSRKSSIAAPRKERRESFLYRLPEASENVDPGGYDSRRTSFASSAGDGHGEDLIVTPFAQILASLKNVRNNFISITGLQQTSQANKPRRKYSTVTPGLVGRPEDPMRLAVETLEELDWCLDQLETIQTHRSVSHMASTKFQRMLGKELSQLEESRSGHQLSQYIFNTFINKDQELDLPPLQSTDGPCEPETPEGYPPEKDFVKAIAATRVIPLRRRKMSRTNAASPTSNVPLPIYGIPCSRINELTPHMEQLNNWGVDIFKINDFTNGRPLSAVLYTILKERGLLDQFAINPEVIIRYFCRIEDHYQRNPYHNAIHGADVAQSVHVLLSSLQLNSVFTDLEVLAALFAGAVHDVDHPGVTNQFLINSGNELAIVYNDESVLEQHHLAVAFKLIHESGCDVFASFSKKERQMVRRIVIDMVLATDMSKHMNLLADLKTTVEAKKVAGSGVLLLDNYTDRIQVLQNIIHLADLSNPTKPLNLYRDWTQRIMEEYWKQGSKEKKLGLDVSPMCDKETTTIETTQVGFIDYIVHPLWETWADLVFPDASEILDNLTANRDWYHSQIPPEERAPCSKEGSDSNPSSPVASSPTSTAPGDETKS